MAYNLKFSSDNPIDIVLKTRGQAKAIVEALANEGIHAVCTVNKVVDFAAKKESPKNDKKVVKK